MRRLMLSACLCVAVQAVCLAENWPHWRGPGMNGVASDRPAPVTWSATENIAWKFPLPDLSGSTPIIWSQKPCEPSTRSAGISPSRKIRCSW